MFRSDTVRANMHHRVHGRSKVAATFAAVIAGGDVATVGGHIWRNFTSHTFLQLLTGVLALLSPRGLILELLGQVDYLLTQSSPGLLLFLQVLLCVLQGGLRHLLFCSHRVQAFYRLLQLRVQLSAALQRLPFGLLLFR